MPISDSARPLPSSLSPVSRRAFLGRAAAAVGVTGFLAACGGGDEGGGGSVAGVDVVNASSCLGYATLSGSDQQMRTSLNYEDESTVDGQYCANCRFYTAPGDMAPCGGCQIFSGPVSPAGHCTSWAATVAA
jgi:hypothetical protein